MTDQHSFLDDIPAYALGALDPDDAAALEAHLQTCAACRAELVGYRSVGDHLLMAARPQQPPARLRRQLQKRLPGAQIASRPRFAWSFSQTGVALMIVLLFGLNIFSITRLQAFQRQQVELTGQLETGQAALAMLAYAGTKSIPIEGGSVTGTLLLNQEQNSALLIFWNLPQLQENQTYQAWLIDPQGGRTSAGIFRPDIERVYIVERVSSPAALASFVGIGVTVEPAGGSDQPTGERIFKVDF